MTPSRESIYLILDENKLPKAMVRNRVMYSVDILDDDGIVETFLNGGDVLPIMNQPI